MVAYSAGAHTGPGGERWSGARLADQASSMTGRLRTPSSPQAILDLAVDGLKLVDLQVQLLTLDVRESWASVWRSTLLLAIATAALLAALPVAMFGGAEFLRQAWSLSIEFALLLVSGTVLVIAGSLIIWSGRRLAVAIRPLRRSAEELSANLEWVRSVLHESKAEATIPKL
jgi:hypothetical protein